MLLTTACPLDCPDTCSLHAEVVDGKLIGVTAAPGNPFTQDFICQKVSKHAERVYSPERIMTPLRRMGPKGSGQFEPISWDDALELVVAKVRAAIDAKGPDSVVPYLYNSSAGTLNSWGMSVRMWAELGAANVEHTICAATTAASWQTVFGGMPSIHPGDVVHSKFIVVWGANPTVSNIHLPPLIHRAQEAGAKLVVVDPRRTGMAKRADWHLAVNPGTDVALAYGMANLLNANGWLDQEFISNHSFGADEFLAEAASWSLDRCAEVTGIDGDLIAEVTRQWAHSRPSILRLGWGAERNRNGGSNCRAVLSLPVLMGHFGQFGSGVLATTSSLSPIDLRGVSRISGFKDRPERRQVNMNTLGAELCGADGAAPIDVLFIQGANPVVMNPNQRLVIQGMSRDDLFTVVHDQVMTDTCRYADLVLPATTHFESDDHTDSYGSYVLLAVNKVIEPVGESLSNVALTALLAERFGLDAANYRRSISEQTLLTVEDENVRAGGAIEFVKSGEIVQFVNFKPRHFEPECDNRAVLSHPKMGDDCAPKFRELIDVDFPFTVISPATHRTINSMFGEFNSAAFVVHVHPDDADRIGAADAERVRVWNSFGEIRLPLAVDADQRCGTVTIPKGIWMKSAGGLTVNALVPDTLNDLADGACFNDTRVQIERAP